MINFSDDITKEFVMKVLDRIIVSNLTEYDKILIIKDNTKTNIVFIDQERIAQYIIMVFKDASEKQKQHYMKLVNSLELELKNKCMEIIKSCRSFINHSHSQIRQL